MENCDILEKGKAMILTGVILEEIADEQGLSKSVHIEAESFKSDKKRFKFVIIRIKEGEEWYMIYLES